MLYDKNYEEYDKINHPNITFEYNDECTSNNLFYENEIINIILNVMIIMNFI